MRTIDLKFMAVACVFVIGLMGCKGEEPETTPPVDPAKMQGRVSGSPASDEDATVNTSEQVSPSTAPSNL